MASLISSTERALLTGIFNDIFDTFCRNIVIVKSPSKTPVASLSSSNLFGFGESQVEEQYTYTPVSGIYPAVIYYDKSSNAELNPEIVSHIFADKVKIKVRENARAYIQDGETQHIIVDGRTFLLDSDERKQSFLDSAYYVFSLVNTH